jgi:hypothetical protein
VAEPAGPSQEAEDVYRRVRERVMCSGMPFLLGGAYAVREYSGFFRDTRDLDHFCKAEDYPHLLQTLADAGYRTDLRTWKIPTVAVLGNHDYESGEHVAVARELTQAGVQILDWIRNAR